ncbi:MAG: chloride channel protein [Gaiellaceae bacterium]
MSTATPADPQDARAYLRVVLLAAAIGIPAALVAAGFFALVHYLEHWLWDDLPDVLGYESPPWFLVLGLPVVGALIVVVARLFLPGDGGHSPLEGLSAKPTPIAHGPGVALAALGSLPFGAVLGPEAPVVALGSVVGSMAARFGTHPKTAALLSSAGSFSAISTLFGGPVVAGVLLVESAAGFGLGAGVFPVLVPGLVAAAVGFLVFTGFGDWGGLETPGLVVPDLPLYDGVDFGDLGVGLVVGVLAAFVAVSVGLLARRVDGVGGRLGMPLLLVGGGLAVGGLAVLADLFGADSQDVLFSGQASVPDVVAEDSTKVLVVLIIAKFLAYGVSLGCGFRGGYIFPAIFLGVAFASFTVAWFDVSPTLAISVGAAAGMAAQTRLLITPLIFASLLVGSQGADTIPAAVLATTAAWLTVHALDRRLQPAAAQG